MAKIITARFTTSADQQISNLARIQGMDAGSLLYIARKEEYRKKKRLDFQNAEDMGHDAILAAGIDLPPVSCLIFDEPVPMKYGTDITFATITPELVERLGLYEMQELAVEVRTAKYNPHQGLNVRLSVPEDGPNVPAYIAE